MVERQFKLKNLRQARTGFIDYEIAQGDDILKVTKGLNALKTVEIAELCYYGTLYFTPNDPQYTTQWHLSKISANNAWDINAGSPAVTVAVIDSGVDWEHPDLGAGTGNNNYQNVYLNQPENDWLNPLNPSTGNQIDNDGNGFTDDFKGWNFHGNNNDSRDNVGHGTGIAGLIGAKTHNSTGVAGVAGGRGINKEGVKIMSVKISDSQSVSSSILDDAILYAAENGAHIIELALGFNLFDQIPNLSAIDAAIETAVNDFGVLIIAAAGQDPSLPGSNVVYPASHPLVMAVGGTTQQDSKWYPSHFGNNLDISAPAVDLVTTQEGGGYQTTFDGTSGASAIVAGVAALLKSKHPCLTRDQIWDILILTADKVGGYDYKHDPLRPGHSFELGFGRVNAEAALKFDATNLYPADPPLTVTYNISETIGGVFEPDHNIVVNTGATLTITGELRMLPGARIVVNRGGRLIVDGGKITRGACFGRWEGIYVLGNFSKAQPANATGTLAIDDPGVVVLLHGATIEYAFSAIQTLHPDLSWVQDYWGGLVVAEESFFINNRRGVAFMKYDIDNKSRFYSCYFMDDLDDNYAGVTIWDTDGIVFEKCVFDLKQDGILAWDAGCTITKGCVFTSMVNAVAIMATSPVSSGDFVRVDANKFIDNANHIASQATSRPKGLIVNENDFISTTAFDFGVWLEGPSQYSIFDNSFNNMGTGVFPVNTSNKNNYVNCNTFKDGWFGILAAGDNEGLTFFDNAFATADVNFSLWEADNAIGKIAPVQGGVNDPADNCFSQTHPENIWTVGVTQPFDYYVPQNTTNACKIPGQATFGTDNYNVVNTTFQVTSNCPIVPEGLTGPFTVNNYTVAKGDELTLVNQVAANPGNAALHSQLHLASQTKERIIDWFLSDALASGNLQNAVTVLNTENTKEAKRLLYGLYLEKRDFSNATTALNAIPIQKAEDQEFKTIQEINLDRLQANTIFTLSTEQHNTLWAIANSESGVRAYARALLSLLEEASFMPVLPNAAAPFNANLPGVQALATKVPDANIFPNPANAQISLAHTERINGDIAITVFDVHGREQQTTRFEEGQVFSLEVGQLPQGVYFLSLTHSGQVISRDRKSVV